jgi:hypothetical protein
MLACRRGLALMVGAVFSIVLAAAPGSAAAAPEDAAAALEAQRLSRKLDEMFRSKSSRSKMIMTVTTPQFERRLELQSLSRGLEDTLVVILSPQKERGTATLKRGREMWNYLPKVAKTIRVPPSMMMGSWMGSDVTNDDMVRGSSWEKDYSVAFARDRETPELRCLQYVPRPGAAVTWSRIVGCIDRATELPKFMEYYDEKARKARSMVYTDVRNLGGRTLPAQWRIEPHLPDRQGHRTVVQIAEMAWDVPVTDEDFSQTALRRGL